MLIAIAEMMKTAVPQEHIKGRRKQQYCLNRMHPGKSINIIEIPDLNDKDVVPWCGLVD